MGRAVAAMTTAITSSSLALSPGEPFLHALAAGQVGLVRFTVEQYHRMIEAGILPEDSTVELLHGILVRKDRSVVGEDPMGHSPLHRKAVRLLTKLAARIDSERRHLQIQLPISVPPDHEPEPDAAVILGADDAFTERLPTAAEAMCVIEVAHSSLSRDRESKLPIFAAGGVPQYLVVNLRANAVEIYADPDPAAGAYRTKATRVGGEVVALNLGAGETLEVAVNDILP